MAKEQKHFLKRVRETWEAEFPFLKPVDLDEVPKIPRGCNYCCGNYVAIRGVFYFVTFDFSPVCPGEFSLGITVSDSAHKSVLNPPTDYRPTPTNVGSYNIAVFMGRQAFLWDLVGTDDKVNSMLASLRTTSIVRPTPLTANMWKPSSYDLPFAQIADEAIRDVNSKLRRFVLPKLQIDELGCSKA